MEIKEIRGELKSLEVSLTLDSPEKVLAFLAVFNPVELPKDSTCFLEQYPEIAYNDIQRAYRRLVPYDDWKKLKNYLKEL